MTKGLAVHVCLCVYRIEESNQEGNDHVVHEVCWTNRELLVQFTTNECILLFLDGEMIES